MKRIDKLFDTKAAYNAAAGVPDLEDTLRGLQGEEYLNALEAAGTDMQEYSKYCASAYRCQECGNVMYGRYRSKYESLPACPICGVDDMWTYR